MSHDILLSLIDTDPGQPRRHFDPAALDELAQSFQQTGLIQPILLRPIDSRYAIVHGERRYRAAGLLGWQTIPADVREMTEDEARLVALIENVQRADLSPIEEARAYEAQLSGGMTQAALGERIGKSQSYIAGKLRYLSLPDDVKTALETGRITEGHAKQVLRLAPCYHSTVANVITERALSVAQSKNAVDWFLEAYSELAPYGGPNDPRRLFIIGAWRVLLDEARRAADSANTLKGYERCIEIASAAHAELSEITLRWQRKAGAMFRRLKDLNSELSDEENAMIREGLSHLALSNEAA